MLSNPSDLNQISNKASSEYMQNIQHVIKDTIPSQKHPQSSSTPAKTPEMSSIFERFHDAFNLNRFQPNFKLSFLRAYGDHPKLHQKPNPRQKHPQSPSTPAKTREMSSIFEKVLDAFKLNRFQPKINIASSEHKEMFQNIIKNTSSSQEHPPSSSTPAKNPEMSSIFERVLDAFKLNRFQPNLKHM
jgi:hypothetical protein